MVSVRIVQRLYPGFYREISFYTEDTINFTYQLNYPVHIIYLMKISYLLVGRGY